MLFEISNISSSNSKLIVFSRSANTVSDYMSDVAQALRERQYIGVIVFDLLLSNGMNDRYYSAYFNGSNFDLSSFSQYTEVSIDIKHVSNVYYRENIGLLRMSVLTKVQKQQLIHGIRCEF